MSWLHQLKKWEAGDFPIPSSIDGKVCGFYWETTPILDGDLKSQYEEVWIPSKTLNFRTRPTPKIFGNKLRKTVPAAFENLSRDTILVCPPNQGKNYSHLATFYANASIQTLKKFWLKVAETIRKEIKNQKTIYVSTAGDGVSWVHVRISSRPKYFKSFIYR